MKKWTLRLFAVVLCTAVGCVPSSGNRGGGGGGGGGSGGCPSCGGAELPVCTLQLPQSTLPDVCPVTGGACKCGCQEGLECTCGKDKVKVKVAGRWVLCKDGTHDSDWMEGSETKGKFVSATGLYHSYDGSRFVSTVRLPSSK